MSDSCSAVTSRSARKGEGSVGGAYHGSTWLLWLRQSQAQPIRAAGGGRACPSLYSGAVWAEMSRLAGSWCNSELDGGEQADVSRAPLNRMVCSEVLGLAGSGTVNACLYVCVCLRMRVRLFGCSHRSLCFMNSVLLTVSNSFSLFIAVFSAVFKLC